MNVLVAGGAGFIGSHFVDALLARGDFVVIVDSFTTGRQVNIDHLRGHRNCHVFNLDIRDGWRASQWSTIGPYGYFASVLKKKFDAVVNLASPASPSDFLTKPLEILETGSVGSKNLLNLATDLNARYLFASTSEVYGDPEVHPQPETYNGSVSTTGPRACYDEAKRFAEALTLAYERVHDTDVAIVRIFNTYGERMDPADGRVINSFVVQALKKEPLTVHGDGSQTRSFCHVDDTVAGLIKVLDHTTTRGPINIGNSDEISMYELAETVVEVTGSSSEIIQTQLPPERFGDPKQRCPDLLYADRMLRYRPQVGLREGIERLAAWYRLVEKVG